MLSALWLGTAALADVTADEVWQNWKDLAAASGQTLSVGTELRAGDTLTLGAVRYQVEAEGTKAVATIDQVVMRERGDGTVEITLSPEYPMTVETPREDGQTTVIDAMFRHSGLQLIAGGSATETSYDLSAESISGTLVRALDAGVLRDVAVDVLGTGLAASYMFRQGTPADVASTFSLRDLTISAAVNDPEKQAKFKLDAKTAQIAGASSGSLVDGMESGDLAKMLADGFATELALTFGASDYSFSSEQDGGTAEGNSIAAGGSLNFALDRLRAAYGVGAKGVTMRFAGSGLPIPEVSFGYDELAFNILTPISKTNTPQDFALTTKIVGLNVSDLLWMLIDANGQLPHDPATLVIEARGKAQLNVDLAAGEDVLGAEVPADLHALDLTALQLTVAGAELKGSGGLT
ncbi:MAG: hypothetical protein U1D06_10835, partial [Paracoccaceae bacterium]|nr:hypothetical protein [Paracoccaceae bacterium]